MNRRRFLLTGACCAAHGLLPGSVGIAQQQDDSVNLRYFCANVDRLARPADISRPQSSSSIGEAIGQPMTPGTSPPLMLTPYGTAFKEFSWLPTDGLTPGSSKITLGIAFLGGTRDQQERTKAGAMRWLTTGIEQRIAFRFDVPAASSQIRITYDSGLGSFSDVGRLALRKAKTARTMNIADAFSPVIEHEFGHALGLEHEHNFPGALRWRPEQVIADMLPYWKKDTPKNVQEQITDRLPDRAACVGSPYFNAASVMLYPVRPNWAEINDNGVWKPYVTAGGLDISKGDYACVRGLYNVG